MASYAIVRHKVRNFSEWKPAFDAHVPTSAAAGLTMTHLLRGADDPNEVIIIFAAADLDRAKAFAASDDLKEAMQKAGVVDQPDIYFLTD
ncbi:MAG: DUF3764 family protein [Blastocatellia bacterium]